jgi:MoaA/NifB/PqqE/SkfB family radical SAM enzyme
VDARGLVYPCEILPQLFPEADPAAGIEDWSLGSLRESDYDLGKIMGSERARRARAWIKDKRCYCTFECAAYNNIVFSPRQWPSVLRRLMKRRFEV